MKIAYISSSIIPSRAANSIHVMKVCQAFSDLGHEVILIAPDIKERYEQNVNNIYEFYGVKNVFNVVKIPWLGFLKGKVFLYGFLAALKTVIFNATLVFCRDFYGAFFASSIGKKVVFESHTPIGDKNTRSLNARLFKRMIVNKNFLTLVVITNSLKDYYLENFPLLEGKIIVAADGADPVAPGTQAFEFEDNEKRMQVGYVGHLYSGRGIDIIIELATLCEWADFHIIGGVEADIEYWKDFSKTQENIVFHGFVTPSVAERMRMGCDVLLAPYQATVAVSGGKGNTVEWMSPLKIFEYMAAGKAILSSDLPVLYEVLEHKRNALLCKPDDADDWADKLGSLRDEPEMLQLLATNSLNDFTRLYSWYSRVEYIMKMIKFK